MVPASYSNKSSQALTKKQGGTPTLSSRRGQILVLGWVADTLKKKQAATWWEAGSVPGELTGLSQQHLGQLSDSGYKISLAPVHPEIDD